MLPGTYNDDDPDAVKHDTLVDARVEIESARTRLQTMYVTLDGLADDREGIWTEDERAEIRMMQQTMEALIGSCDENMVDVEDEIDGLL